MTRNEKIALLVAFVVGGILGLLSAEWAWVQL